MHETNLYKIFSTRDRVKAAWIAADDIVQALEKWRLSIPEDERSEAVTESCSLEGRVII